MIVEEIRFKTSLDLFLKEFWFAPSDVFLRATESLIWSKQKLKSPVLDIGCGDGRISKLLFDGKKKIDVGLDVDPKEIKNARRSRVYKRVVLSDVAKMPFKDKSFNTIISNSTLEHIKDDVQAAKEASRVLKKGGLFLFTVPSERLKKVLKELIQDENGFKAFNKRVSHYHYRTLKEWEKILKGHDLEVVHTEYYFSPEAVRAWYSLFRLATFKPYQRELWSYLKDSPYGKLAPKKLITFLLEKYLRRFYKDMFTRNGCWLFIIAQKKK